MDPRRRRPRLSDRGKQFSPPHGARDGRGDDRRRTRPPRRAQNRGNPRRTRPSRSPRERAARWSLPRRSPLLSDPAPAFTSPKSAPDARIVPLRSPGERQPLGGQGASPQPVQKPSRSLEKIAIFWTCTLEIRAPLVHAHCNPETGNAKEADDDAVASGFVYGRENRHHKKTGQDHARGIECAGREGTQEGRFAAPGRARYLPQAQDQGADGPQSGDWAGDQDSGAHSASLHGGQGAQGFGSRREII